jgi:hypothetical protein
VQVHTKKYELDAAWCRYQIITQESLPCQEDDKEIAFERSFSNKRIRVMIEVLVGQTWMGKPHLYGREIRITGIDGEWLQFVVESNTFGVKRSTSGGFMHRTSLLRNYELSFTL